MDATKPRIFIVAGMPRAATTFLYQRFQEHPAIFCPYRKETNFFSVNHEKGASWYRALYAEMATGQIGADVSPAYFLDERAIDRIREFDPRIKVILGVRPASEWALSWYTQVLTHHWRTKPGLAEVLGGYRYRIGGGEIWVDLRNGFVWRTIGRYREAFGEDLLLYHHRALREDPLAVVNAIERFLGVPSYFSQVNFQNEIVNAGTRRNVRLAAHLLSREQFINAVGRMVPRRLVQAARNAYVALGTSKKVALPPSFTPEEMALAGATLSEDDAWIESEFAYAAIQLGSGDAFEAGDTGAGAGSDHDAAPAGGSHA